MTISSSQSCPLKSKVPNSKFQRAKMAQNKIKQLVSVPHEFFILLTIMSSCFLWHSNLCFCDNETLSKWHFEKLSTLSKIKSKIYTLVSNNASNRDSLFIHLLTRFSMKSYYLCIKVRAPSAKIEKCAFTIIERHNYLPYFGLDSATQIINTTFTLHREVTGYI